MWNFIGFCLLAGGVALAWYQFREASQYSQQESHLKAQGRYADAVAARAYGGGQAAFGVFGIVLAIVGFLIIVV